MTNPRLPPSSPISPPSPLSNRFGRDPRLDPGEAANRAGVSSWANRSRDDLITGLPSRKRVPSTGSRSSADSVDSVLTWDTSRERYTWDPSEKARMRSLSARRVAANPITHFEGNAALHNSRRSHHQLSKQRMFIEGPTDPLCHRHEEGPVYDPLLERAKVKAMFSPPDETDPIGHTVACPRARVRNKAPGDFAISTKSTLWDREDDASPASVPPSPDGLTERDREIVRSMKEMFTRKFTKVDKAFFSVNDDKSGGITREELQDYFSNYAAPPVVADFFYDQMDTDQSGSIGLQEFARVMGPVIQNDDFCLYSSAVPRKQAKKREKCAKALNDEDKVAIRNMKDLFVRKFKTVTRAYFDINGDAKGGIDREELRSYFARYAAPVKVADFFYDQMDRDNSGDVGLEEFKRVFGPLILDAEYDVLPSSPNSRHMSRRSSAHSLRSTAKHRAREISHNGTRHAGETKASDAGSRAPTEAVLGPTSGALASQAPSERPGSGAPSALHRSGSRQSRAGSAARRPSVPRGPFNRSAATQTSDDPNALWRG